MVTKMPESYDRCEYLDAGLCFRDGCGTCSQLPISRKRIWTLPAGVPGIRSALNTATIVSRSKSAGTTNHSSWGIAEFSGCHRRTCGRLSSLAHFSRVASGTDGSLSRSLVRRRPAQFRVHHARWTSGVPAICLPCGFAPEGVPYSIQFAGRQLSEGMLCRFAHAYEQATSWRDRHPAV